MENIYEVQSLKDGRWMIEHRCRNEDEAIAEARDLYETRHYRAVKVVKEMFDNAAKLYKETTVFRHPQEGQKTAPQERPATRPAKAPRKKAAGPAKRGLFDFLRQ